MFESKLLDITGIPFAPGKSLSELLADYWSFDAFKRLYVETATELLETIKNPELLSIEYFLQEEGSDKEIKEKVLDHIAKKFVWLSFILDVRDEIFICFDSFWGDWFIDSYKRWDIYPVWTFSRLEVLESK